MLTTAALDLKPLENCTFGAVVTGVTLASIDDETFAALYRAWLDFALLIFPGQHVRGAEHLAFAKRFGPLFGGVRPVSNMRRDGTVRADDNTDRVVKILKGNMNWHQDFTYVPVQTKGAVLSSQVVPSKNGETCWADMCASYDALSPAMKERIDGLRAYHSLNYSQTKLGYVNDINDMTDGLRFGAEVKDPPLRPLVKVHPETGRKALMIGRHAHGISGLSETESEKLLEELATFACRLPRVYFHRWTPGDVVVYDNRCLMHRACPWNMREPRVMHHASIAGDPVAEFASPALISTPQIPK
jgi:alpha-ketoglutarate-dependent taurine dioxygenase